MADLKWSVTKCENPECGFDFREAKPGQLEKGNDINGRLIWNAHCPKCGRGYQVGYRVLPKPPEEVVAEMEDAPVLIYGEERILKDKTEVKASGVPPDKRGADLAKKEEENPDPEGLLTQEPVAPPKEKVEPGGIKPPGPGEYFCTKHASIHRKDSKIGKSHLKYQE